MVLKSLLTSGRGVLEMKWTDRQIGYKTAEEYGKLAAETAKQMRV